MLSYGEKRKHSVNFDNTIHSVILCYVPCISVYVLLVTGEEVKPVLLCSPEILSVTVTLLTNVVPSCSYTILHYVITSPYFLLSL